VSTQVAKALPEKEVLDGGVYVAAPVGTGTVAVGAERYSPARISQSTST